MPVFNVKPKFLYPRSRQFPFDEVAEQIVRELEKRNFKVPGITVDFDQYGSGELKYQRVFHVVGEEFKLTFMRIQGLLDGDFNDIAALSNLYIPKQILNVYSDESGPTYYLYVGENWEADKNWWYEGIKVNAKLDKEPRRYLKYIGNNRYHERASKLLIYTDIDREYSPIEGEPIELNLTQKFDEFTTWLEEHVLQYILSFKEADIILPPTQEEELIPYHGPWKQFYTMCTGSMVDRITTGKSEPQKLPPEERYAYAGTGNRLVTLDVPRKDRFPEVAYEGFIWCNVTSKLSYVVTNNMTFLWYAHYLISITPKYANHIYVVDNAKYVEKRKELFEAIAPRERLTDEEFGDVLAARGATIVPITEYQGDYADPIVLIDRELDFDEVEVISKIV